MHRKAPEADITQLLTRTLHAGSRPVVSSDIRSTGHTLLHLKPSYLPYVTSRAMMVTAQAPTWVHAPPNAGQSSPQVPNCHCYPLLHAAVSSAASPLLCCACAYVNSMSSSMCAMATASFLEKKKKFTIYIFPANLGMIRCPTGGPADVHLLSEHASTNQP